MVLSEIELEEQLKETGNALLDPPSSIDDLLHMLDKLEHLLINVDQAPSISMQDALLPTMKALISDPLLKNSDVDVKLYVASCLSEITRITAPDAPYSDAHMKEIFELIVESMEKLSNGSSRSCTKAVSILETAAKVRSCLVMLDLELDELIIKMFQHFLKIIRSNHSHTVFESIETIMTLIIDESEDISMDLLTSLLASVKKDNQSVSPSAWKLGEKVITNCAAKLKPYLKEVLQSEKLAKDDYASVVESLCGDKSHSSDHDHSNDSRDHLVTKRLSPSSTSHGEISQGADGNSNSLSNTSNSTKNVASDVQNNSSRKKDSCSIIQSESTDTVGNTDPETNLEKEPVIVPGKRGRKPNSLMNPDEGYDHSWISQGRKTAKSSSKRKSHNEGTDAKKEIPAFDVRKLVELSPKSDGISSGSQPKKRKAKRSLDSNSSRLDEKEVLETAIEVDNLSEDEFHFKKPLKGKDNEKKKKHESSGKPLLKSTKKRVGDVNQDISLAKTDVKKRKSAGGISDGTEASGVMKIKSCDKGASSKEENPQTNLKKKRTPRKEVLSPALDIGPELVGSRVRIWWPLDSVFYEAVVRSYDPSNRRHRVLYTDGEVERLNLRKELWELIKDDNISDKEVQTDTAEADSSTDMIRAEKGKGSVKSESAKQRKANVKRSGSTGTTKKRAGKSGGKTGDLSAADKAKGDSTRRGSSSEGDTKSYNGNSKMKSRVKIELVTPENSE